MDNIFNAKWIKREKLSGTEGLRFSKSFKAEKEVKNATLQVTAHGIYSARVNGKKVSDYVFAPGWTAYHSRLQYQTYDVTDLLNDENTLDVDTAQGWYFHRRDIVTTESLDVEEIAIIAALEIEYADGTKDSIYTDNSWTVSENKTRYAHFYNGCTYDANFEPDAKIPALEIEYRKDLLIPQQGEIICEQDCLPAKELFVTPRGEVVIDFGQNLTGYVEFNIQGKKGDECYIRHAEVLDKDGNFYTDNLRGAKQEVRFICDGNPHTYKPEFTFQGFRYIQLCDWPEEIDMKNFTAIAVHSDMERIGYFECSDPLLNKLFENIVWGQKGNFLDVPTDCPQRDERLGWTGDAQVFVRTASYNYNVEKFFIKWLADLAAEQFEDGQVPHIVPNKRSKEASTAWADAATICPWQVYVTYGNKQILENQFDSMKKWVDYMKGVAIDYRWETGKHYGDWLSLDTDPDSCYGGTDKHLIATAFFAYSTAILVKAGKALGKDMSEYEELFQNIAKAYREKYIVDGKVTENTQTACLLTLYFDLAAENQKASVAQQLVDIVNQYGHLTTGFVGTPYLLHVLTQYGHTKLAYDLILRKEYPSWLYPVTMGATTMWEHWDSLRPDGTMWSTTMNSFNHYAYGAVGDWMYGSMAGINPDENAPGFKHIIFKPVTDERLDYVTASIHTKYGTVASKWVKTADGYNYTFTVPQGCTATVCLNGKCTEVGAGEHNF